MELFPPPAKFSDKAWVKSTDEYTQMYRASIDDPEQFWGDKAKEFYWQTPFNAVGPNYNFHRSSGNVSIEWFAGGKTNVSYNSLDRHVEAGDGDRISLYYEPNHPNDAACRNMTYKEFLAIVCRIANALRHGSSPTRKGDRVSLFLPMIIELPASMLACARIGAVHCVIFGGFSAKSLASRIHDVKSNTLITVNGVVRGTSLIQWKSIADKAVELCMSQGFDVGKLVCLKRLENEQVEHAWNHCRDVWFDEWICGMPAECECEWMGSEDPLFILYTSGSTSKPKGVLHTTGGYMIGTSLSTKYAFDIHRDDIWFCTGDCGWITGHSYIVYGPLLNGVSQVLFEGTPVHPNPGRLWALVAEYKVTAFCTTPAVIRLLMRSGKDFVKKHDCSSLRLLGSFGQALDSESWSWYYNVVGEERCALVDAYLQTESGSLLITPLPGAMSCKPGSAALPFFGVQLAILDYRGMEIEGECSGHLCLKRPVPSMMRAVFGNHACFEEAYFAQHNGYYFTGDGCKRDKDGYYWLIGRTDCVLNVAGYIIGEAEIEVALLAHSAVAEAAVVPFPHSIKGQGIWAYVVLKEDIECPLPYTEQVAIQINSLSEHIVGSTMAGSVLFRIPFDDLPTKISAGILQEKIAEALRVRMGDLIVFEGERQLDPGQAITDTSSIIIKQVRHIDPFTEELKLHVQEEIGAFARPDQIQLTPGLPRTRAGMRMRRILRKLARPDYEDQDLGDLAMLADPSIIAYLIENHPLRK